MPLLNPIINVSSNRISDRQKETKMTDPLEIANAQRQLPSSPIRNVKRSNMKPGCQMFEVNDEPGLAFFTQRTALYKGLRGERAKFQSDLNNAEMAVENKPEMIPVMMVRNH